ncbi:cytochrome C oxidase subunit II [Exiguobacterium sp. Helios]|nr:cytochrome C oxidase subunit II [Exiguobacterium sp. Helios]
MRRESGIMSSKPEPNLSGTIVAVFIVASVIIGMWGSIFLLFSSR